MFKASILAATVALGLSAGAASAADLYRAPPPVAPVAPTLLPAYSWTGAYVGAQVGYLWGDSGWRFGNGTTVNPKPDGVLAGIHAGFNWQYSQLVLGLDGSWSWADARSSRVCPNALFTCSTNVNWTADVRGRVGFAFDRFQVYAAGGLAFADVRARAVSGFADFRDTNTQVGWTAGLGAEFAVTNNVILGVEWKYSDYGRESFNLGPDTARNDLTTNVVQLRASYKF